MSQNDEAVDESRSKKHYSSRETKMKKPSSSMTSSMDQQVEVRVKVGQRRRLIQETYEEEELSIESSISRIDNIHLQYGDHSLPLIDLSDEADPSSRGTRPHNKCAGGHSRPRRSQPSHLGEATDEDDDPGRSSDRRGPRGRNRGQHVVKDDEQDLPDQPGPGSSRDKYRINRQQVVKEEEPYFPNQRGPGCSRDRFGRHNGNRRQHAAKDDDSNDDEDEDEIDHPALTNRRGPEDAYVPRGQSRVHSRRGGEGCGAQPAIGTKHFSHRHPLKQARIRSKDNIFCNFCDTKISGAAFECGSKECDFFIHQVCFQIPTNIKSHFYQQDHTLTIKSVETAGEDLSCRACQNDIDSQFSHYYSCTSCDEYQIHVICASMPMNLNANNVVEYPLTLFFSPLLGKDHRHKNKCVICKHSIIEGSWIYYNKKHDFATHLICPVSKQEDDEFLFGVMIRLVRKASHDERHENQYSDNQLRKQDISEDNVVFGFGHPHPIKEFLTQELERYLKEIDMNCWVCGPQGSDKYYGCLVCGFFVCKTCFRLPEKIQFSNHCDQTFLNLNEFDNNGNHRTQQGNCFLCGYPYDLAFYGCNVCHYGIHARCLGNSKGITYDNNGHRFRLVQGNDSAKNGGGNCSMCHRFVAKASNWVYKREGGDTIYCLWCASDSFNSLMSIDEVTFVNRVQSYKVA